MRWSILILLVMIVLPVVNAEITGIADVGEQISPQYCRLDNECQIRIQCTYNFASVGAGGTANITIFYPDNSSLLVDNQAMSRVAEYFTYSITPNLIGSYSYSTQCCEMESCSPGGGAIIVNPTGKEYSIPQAITYIILFVIVILLFIFSIFGFLRFPFKNNRNNEGNLLSINYQKYLKMGCFVLAYLSIVAILFFAWNITYAFLYFGSMANFFRAAYTASLVLVIPVFLAVVIISIYNYVNDKKFQSMIERGLSIRE